MKRSDVHYMGAGPSPLPHSVIEKGAQAFVNFEESGLSLVEISHRSPTAAKILADTKEALISLLDIPDNYEVLFMVHLPLSRSSQKSLRDQQGGGSAQFSAVPMNLVAVWVEKRRRIAEKELGNDSEAILQRVRKELREDLRLDYLVTGSWSLKASQEAANLFEPLGKEIVNVAVDARQDGKFGAIPPESSWRLSPKSAFVYYCDNETVDGVEFPAFPKCLESSSNEEEPIVVADMSSNILSRRVDVGRYGCIYGGAQKNLGITDLTVVIVRTDLLTTVPSPSFLHTVGVWSPPIVLNWSVIAKNNSLYNTLPIFSVWIAGEVMRGLLSTHGSAKVAGQEAIANAKAEKIYRILDDNPRVFQPVNEKNVRSRMNICFRVGDPANEKKFLEGSEQRSIQGIKGHRSVGGVRVSNYNAVHLDSIQRLADYLIEFAEGKPSI